MLSILRVLNQNCSAYSNVASLASAIDKNAFKVIYVQVAVRFSLNKVDQSCSTNQGTNEGTGF